MALELKVEDCHLLVSDGCKIDSLDTNIVNVVGTRFVNLFIEADFVSRMTSEGPSKKYLLRRNLSHIHTLYDCNLSLELVCPKCDVHYTLTKKDFESSEQAYQELTRGIPD